MDEEKNFTAADKLGWMIAGVCVVSIVFGIVKLYDMRETAKNSGVRRQQIEVRDTTSFSDSLLKELGRRAGGGR